MEWFKDFFSNKHRMGFRIVKTGMAVTICLAVANVLKLDSPIFTVIAAVVTMGKSIDLSFRAGKNRAIGTLAGAFFGVCFAMLAPGNIGLCGIGVILTLYACHVFKLKGAGALACIVFSAIMLDSSGLPPWFCAADRLTDTFIGIGVALFVNIAIMPPSYMEDVKRAYSSLCDLIRESIDFASTGDPIDVPAMEAELRRLSAGVKAYISEARFLRGNDEEVFQISRKVSTFQEILHELRSIELLEPRPVPKEHSLRPVFEYHLERLLSLYSLSEELN